MRELTRKKHNSSFLQNCVNSVNAKKSSFFLFKNQQKTRGNAAQILKFVFLFLHCQQGQGASPPSPFPQLAMYMPAPGGDPRHVHCKLGEGGEGGVKLWAQNYGLLIQKHYSQLDWTFYKTTHNLYFS